MVRPQVTVNISGALPSASLPTDTGVLLFVYAGTGGPTTPESVTSIAEATAAGVPDATAAWIGDALNQGAAEVIVLRAEAADASAVTESEWDAALAKLTPGYGPGQIAIAGVGTTAAHTALLAHVATNPQRIALLDVPEGATAAAIATATAAVAAMDGAERAGIFGPWLSMPGTGAARTTPASVIAAGLAARGDAAVGHANQAPIFDQGRGAGVVSGALAVDTVFTDTETDTLYDAGANVFRPISGVITLTGWKAVGGDPVWRQLNIGRLTMEVSAIVSARMYQYLGAPIDGQGILLSQVGGVLTGYLSDLYGAGALFGETPEAAFTVVCDSTNNTPATIAAGEVHADVAITASTAAEQIVINVVTSLAS